MHQNKRAGVQFKRAFGDLSRVDGDVIDSALALFLIADDDVLAVQINDAELFGFAVRHRGVTIIKQSVPA